MKLLFNIRNPKTGAICCASSDISLLCPRCRPIAERQERKAKPKAHPVLQKTDREWAEFFAKQLAGNGNTADPPPSIASVLKGERPPAPQAANMPVPPPPTLAEKIRKGDAR